MTRRTLIIFAVWWIVLLGGLWLSRQVIIWTGTQVYLSLEPVDPRDLFRGDYVTLRYEISDWESLNDCEGLADAEFEQGRTVYVALQVENSEAVGVCRSMNMKTAQAYGDLVIQGKMSYGGWSGNESIEYGIESYFVGQGSGIRVENGRDSKALVSIGKNGKSSVVGLMVDGQRI